MLQRKIIQAEREAQRTFGNQKPAKDRAKKNQPAQQKKLRDCRVHLTDTARLLRQHPFITER
jgi:hypothetical protein